MARVVGILIVAAAMFVLASVAFAALAVGYAYGASAGLVLASVEFATLAIACLVAVRRARRASTSDGS